MYLLRKGKKGGGGSFEKKKKPKQKKMKIKMKMKSEFKRFFVCCVRKDALLTLLTDKWLPCFQRDPLHLQSISLEKKLTL